MNNNRARKPPTFRERINPLETMSDSEIIKRYRLNLECIDRLTDIVAPEIRRPTNRSHAVTPQTQVLLSLRILASGSFQSVVGDTLGLSDATVSRCFGKFLDITSTTRHPDLAISFPSTAESINSVKQGFHGIRGFPNVIGAVDGTLVPIKPPSVDEHVFVSRKGFHALNVQVICDHNLM